ncbi:MAG: hypothetical protein AAF628_02610 [Planctomycetota bacterium]
MRTQRVLLVTGLLLLPLLNSCQSIRRALLGQEPALASSDSYLQRGEGPPSGVSLGEGGEKLLSRFQQVLDEKLALEKRNDVLQEEIEALRQALQRESEDRDQERHRRGGLEAEVARLSSEKADRETKILHLHLQVAQLQRAKLELEIAALEHNLEQMDPPPAMGLASPVPVGH